MGFGLIIAVLGLGSTFAASININGGQDAEFGQGRTRTVFCGGEQEVTIAPISTYVNTVLAEPGISFSARFATEYYTDRVGDFTPYNGISTTVNGKTGWWLLAINSAALAPDQDLLAIKTSTASEIFSERKIVNDVEGYYKVRSPAPFEEIVMPAVEFSEATFRTAGVLISDIPEQCDDVTFVLSFFGATGTAQTMISKVGQDDVKEVAYTWYYTPTPGTGYDVSSSRTSFVPTSLVTADTTADSLKFVFTSAGATVIEADDLDKIVIETQADSILDVSP
jgi:hypothetical protein